MRLVLPRLYVILDASLSSLEETACAELLAGCGVHLVQYRNKRAPARELVTGARRLAEFFRPRGITFLVNDRPDVALLAGATGVHVGQEDLEVEEARKILGLEKWVGVSTHNREQIIRAGQSSADYIAVGPVFPTTTKENPDPVVGMELIREARSLTSKPIVAIGGITLERAAEVVAADADSVVVVSDIWGAPDPQRRIGQYQKVLVAGAAAT